MTIQSLTREERIAILERHLGLGTLLTHTRCGGCLEEHVFTGRDGAWLCGKPTRETKLHGGSKLAANDIATLRDKNAQIGDATRH